MAGLVELRGEGQFVKELSPYEADLDWEPSPSPTRCPLLRYLGQATAKVHCVSDAGSDQALVDFQTEEAIVGPSGTRTRRSRGTSPTSAPPTASSPATITAFVDSFRNGEVPGLKA